VVPVRPYYPTARIRSISPFVVPASRQPINRLVNFHRRGLSTSNFCDWLAVFQVFLSGHLVTSCKSVTVVVGISVRAPCYIITAKCLRSWCVYVRCAVILSLSQRQLIRSQKPLVSGSISLLLSVMFATLTFHVHFY